MEETKRQTAKLKRKEIQAQKSTNQKVVDKPRLAQGKQEHILTGTRVQEGKTEHRWGAKREKENRQREEVDSLRHDTGGYNYIIKQEITESQPKPWHMTYQFRMHLNYINKL